MTINNTKSMYKPSVVAVLWNRAAELVVSICPKEYIKMGESNM